MGLYDTKSEMAVCSPAESDPGGVNDISLVSGEIDCNAGRGWNPRIHQSDKQSVTVSEGPSSSEAVNVKDRRYDPKSISRLNATFSKGVIEKEKELFFFQLCVIPIPI